MIKIAAFFSHDKSIKVSWPEVRSLREVNDYIFFSDGSINFVDPLIWIWEWNPGSFNNLPVKRYA